MSVLQLEAPRRALRQQRGDRARDQLLAEAHYITLHHTTSNYIKLHQTTETLIVVRAAYEAPRYHCRYLPRTIFLRHSVPSSDHLFEALGTFLGPPF